MRSCLRALAPLLLGLLALPAAAAPAADENPVTPRVSLYAMRIDPGAPLR